MSAGKGDQPRPVNGDRYRANYEAIFAPAASTPVGSAGPADRPPYPHWICAPCGQTHGRGMPKGHVSTWHEDPCGVCGKVTSVSEPRDFGHLKKWPILPKNP